MDRSPELESGILETTEGPSESQMHEKHGTSESMRNLKEKHKSTME